MAKATLYELALDITANSAKLTKELDKTNASLKGFEGKINNVGGQVIGAFTKMGLAIGGFAGALELGKKVINSTEGSADKLEETIGYLEGGFQGLSRSIVTGDWGGLIDNIFNTAAATRELLQAQDELGNILASNTIKKGRLNRELASKKLEIADTTDPNIKKGLIEDAMSIQKEINQINVDEIGKRLKINEDFYKKVMGYGDDYSNFMITKIREIAGNWEHWFGSNSVQIEGLKTRLDELNEKERTLGTWRRDNDNKAILVKSSLTDAEKKEREEIKKSLYVLEDFLTLQEGMKPDEFKNYVMLIGEYFASIGEGDLALKNLQKSLTSQEVKIDKSNDKLKDAKNVLEEYNNKLKETDKWVAKVFGLKAPEPTSSMPGGDAPDIRGRMLRLGTFGGGTETQAEADLKERAKQITEEINNAIQQGMANIAQTFSEGLATLALEGKKGLPNFGSGILSAFASMLDQLSAIAFGVAFGIKAIKKALESLNWEVALAAGIALAALSAGAKAGIKAIAKNQEGKQVSYGSFADGGVIYGETLARVGEYSGARTNPEIIAPLDRLRALLGNTGYGGLIEVRIKDDYLYGSLDRRNRRVKSYAGR